MPSPTTTGGSLMSSPATVDAGGVPPLIVSTDVISYAGAAANPLTGNAVYLFAFEIFAPTTFTGGKWRVGTAATPGTAVIGIYSFAGNLQGTDTGATTNVASTNMSANFTGGNITLAPGQYFAALSFSNSTDNAITLPGSNASITSHMRQATNNASGGLLPSTTGGYTDVPARFPAFSLTVLNGLT